MTTKQLRLLSAIVLLIIFSQQANARIWRVNILSNYNGTSLWGDNFGGTAANPVFKELIQPNGSALVQPGDTIHVEGSIDTYDGVTFTKRLVIIGPGYFLTDNSNTSNDLLEAKIEYIYFNAGSQGSAVMGTHITSIYGIDVDNNVSNITVKRCRIDYDVYIGYDNSDIYIIGNYFSNPAASTTSAIVISIYGFPVNFIFNNNICQRPLLLFTGTTVYSALECKNNVFDCPALTGGNPSLKMLCNNFQNNILKTPGATVEINAGVPGSGVSYNVSASPNIQFGTVNNNIVVLDQTTLFVTSVSADGKYQLKTGSLASGNGSDATDRGAYGGSSVNNHYTLSGLAPIPVIYDISTSGVADATGLPVTIKQESSNKLLMKNISFIAVLLLCNIITTAQNVVQAEYFIDTDAGFGKNSVFTLANPQPDGNYNLNINLTGLAIGYHKLYIRTKDSDGKWGFTARRNIEITSSNVTKKITGGEYFFDTDPGFDAATAITITPQDSAILQNFTAATSSLSLGYHKLYIRLKDNDGKWSLTTRRNVEVINAAVYVIAGAEYFFNTDPGAGGANPVTFDLPASDSSFTFKIPLDKIPTGAHTLYIRARDSVNSNWSITQWQTDSVVTSVQSGLWSQPGTWSNNKVPDATTVVVLHHNVEVDIPTATCKSLTPYRNNVQCIVRTNMKVTITGHR